jgi:hypothetical protein
MYQHTAGRRALRMWLAALTTAAALATVGAPEAQAAGPAAGTFAFNDTVVAVVHAADGSTYVGGNFTAEVPIGGGAPIADIVGLARIAPDGSLDTSWDPTVTPACVDQDGSILPGYIRALAVSGQTLYAVGCYGDIGGQSRAGIGALDTSTATATAWNPSSADTNNRVFGLAVHGSTVYAGGSFTAIGGQSRHGIVALDASTGNATTWNPNLELLGGLPGGIAYTFAFSASTVYVGGYFSAISGQPREGLAAFDAGTGALTAWNPGGYGVDVMTISGETLYAAGVFTTLGGQPRPGLGAVDGATGAAAAWNPAPNGEAYASVYAMAAAGQTIYIGGAMGGQHPYLTAVDATTGAATGWHPAPDGPVEALAVSNSKVYVGGDFTSICGKPAGRYAEIDGTCVGPTTTGTPPGTAAGSGATPGPAPGAGGSLAARPGVVSLARVAVTLRVAPSGAVSITLPCTGQSACRGTAALTVASKGTTHAAAANKTITIGKARYAVAAGRTARVTLKLTGKGRTLLRRAHRRLKATLTITPAGATRPATRKTLTLKAAKAKR